MKQNLAVELTESGYVPDSLVRHGIRQLLRQRLDEINSSDISQMSDDQNRFFEQMKTTDIAVLTQKANEQHY